MDCGVVDVDEVVFWIDLFVEFGDDDVVDMDVIFDDVLFDDVVRGYVCGGEYFL